MTALRPEEGLHDLDTLVESLRTERREFISQYEMAYFLTGDLTQETIEHLAIQLLTSMVAMREGKLAVSRPLHKEYYVAKR